MTRVNLVPVEELTDQHLFAEFRELKMVPKSLARSIKARGLVHVLLTIPSEFVLGVGHVTFFYDKGLYLQKRYNQICKELDKRGIHRNKESVLDEDKVFNEKALWNDYTPTKEALALIRRRIKQKIALKPRWYRKTLY